MLTSLPLIGEWPKPFYNAAFGSTTRSILDAVNDYFSVVMKSPKTGNISKIGFMTADGAGGTLTLTCGLYTVSAAFNPTTTAYGGSSPGTQTNPAAGTAYLVSLATPAATTVGDLFAVKLIVTAFTSGDCRIRRHASNDIELYSSVPCIVNDTGVGATKVAGVPIIYLEYDDGTYAFTPGLRSEISSSGLTCTSVGSNQYGNKFSLPLDSRCVGVWLDFTQTNGPTSTCTFSILDASNNSLASASYAGNQGQTAGTVRLYFASPITLSANTTYRVVYTPAATGRSWNLMNFNSNAAMDVSWNKNFIYTTRAGAGAWTDTSTQCLPLGLLINAVSTPSMLVHPGMGGGMRG